MRAGLIQFTSSDDPKDNLARLAKYIDRAAQDGAELILTPEVSNLVSADAAHQRAETHLQDADPMLMMVRERAQQYRKWIALGSLALRQPASEHLLNRSFLIGPDGEIAAHYDKIHMFDITLPDGTIFKESALYQPGEQAVCVQIGDAILGLSICYDVRFAYLYRDMAQQGANIMLVPAAFTRPTGQAHWHALLRARAIETGSFVLAAAQTGQHPHRRGRMRESYGHSLAISPWGDVIADSGTDEGVTLLTLDLAEANKRRAQIPALQHDRAYQGPILKKPSHVR